ncbi:15830_t:CDS:2, partial [Entrophospora sp. SA101]
VMTDTICSTPNCNIPLLRSKDKSISFCVICDDKETENASKKSYNASSSSMNESRELSSSKTIQSQCNDNSNNNNLILNNDDGGDNDGNREEKEKLKLQREQSQKASQLIGQYLLKGWALTDEICPNDKCCSIPLVRSNDKKSFCVICQNYYINESDLGSLKYEIATSHDSSSTLSLKEKHKQEIESTNQQYFEKPIIIETKDNSYVVRQTVSTLFSTLEFLRNQLKISNDVSHIKLVCDSIKSCVQALEVPENYKHNTRVINNGYGDGNNITSLEEIDLINLDGATVTYNQQNDSSNNLNYNCLIETLLCDLHFGSKSSIGDVVNVLQPKSLAINEKSILDNNHNNKN